MGGARRRLVETLRERGIRDLAVLRAFDLTPRHLFVPTGVRHRAYEDAPLPIGSGQTISQPSIHARYLELLELKGQERVLEIGTGSGYQTVLLSHLVAQIFTIERIPALYNLARENIARAGAKNVSMLLGFRYLTIVIAAWYLLSAVPFRPTSSVCRRWTSALR